MTETTTGSSTTITGTTKLTAVVIPVRKRVAEAHCKNSLMIMVIIQCMCTVLALIPEQLRVVVVRTILLRERHTADIHNRHNGKQ
jgi:hypothetical protein